MLATGSHNFCRKMRGSIEIEKHNTIDQGSVVRKVDSAIHRIVIFSTVVKMPVKL